ncbi:MAG: VOC family protein [Alphaproteobacteria bacterium]|nr:VOC family protein [Alphaproteobacteria bacterium]
MIGYVTLGTNNMEKALAFYDAVLGEVGGKRTWNNDRLQGYGGQGPQIAIGKTYDGKSATSGNGTMIALAASDKDMVARVHAKALAMGGKDEGAPGFRPADAKSGFYGAYFRDLDGNKFAVFTMAKS